VGQIENNVNLVFLSDIDLLMSSLNTGEGLQNFGLCSALRAFGQGRIFIVPHLL
jgi:hypothetical protein